MNVIDSLQSRLEAGETIIMDGAMGTEIQRRGVRMGRYAYMGEPLLTSSETIRIIHEDNIRAGAEIIITDTFNTSRASLETAGLSDRTLELNKLAVRLAKEARENAPSDKPVVIAGSMSSFPPKTDATVTPNYDLALADYREQAQNLAEAGVDVILIEMIVRSLDAKAAVEGASATGLPIWIAFSCLKDNGNLFLGVHGKRRDETLSDGVAAVLGSRVSAMFLMHTLSEDAAQGLRELKEVWSGPLGAYPHTGDWVPGNWISKDLISPPDYLGYAKEWVNMGAQIIGGCCGITPEHIRVLADDLSGGPPGL